MKITPAHLAVIEADMVAPTSHLTCRSCRWAVRDLIAALREAWAERDALKDAAAQERLKQAIIPPVGWTGHEPDTD